MSASFNVFTKSSCAINIKGIHVLCCCVTVVAVVDVVSVAVVHDHFLHYWQMTNVLQKIDMIKIHAKKRGLKT